jgi:hypothetical protein
MLGGQVTATKALLRSLDGIDPAIVALEQHQVRANLATSRHPRGEALTPCQLRRWSR